MNITRSLNTGRPVWLLFIATLVGYMLATGDESIAQSDSTLTASVSRWPPIPTIDSSLKEKIGAETTVTVSIDTMSLTAPPLDPLQFGVVPAAYNGVLVYLPRVKLPDKALSQQYLVLRWLDSGTEPTSVVNYHDEVPVHTYDPQLSPDGSRLLFKASNGSSAMSSYALCLWDFNRKVLLSVSSEYPTYERVSWSPDSNHVEYCLGGDVDGIETEMTSRLHLFTYNVQTKKSHFVVRDPEAKILGWTPEGTLLYTAAPPEQAFGPFTKGKEPPAKDVSVGIYETAPDKGPGRLLIRNGYAPSASPDGKWIAFFGWHDKKVPLTSSKLPTKPVDSDTGPDLYLFDRKQGTRRPLRKGADGVMRWSPDSKRLIVIQSSYQYTGRNAGLGHALVDVVDIATTHWSRVAELSASDLYPGPRAVTNPQFDPFGVSKDGKALFVSISELRELDRHWYTELKTMDAVNLDTGVVQPFVKITNKWASVTGWDFREGSLSIKPTASH